jgi:hypothetical protein
MRRCARCGEEKPLSEFAWRRREKGQRHNYCRPCHAEYRREHYLKNRRKYIGLAQERNRRRYAEGTELLLEYFADHPCLDCGEKDPLVLEFDHLRDKAFNIATKMTAYSWETVLEEIAKCEVVCGNCHKRRTARRRRSNRARLTGLTDPRTDKGPGEPGPPPCL